MSSIITLWHEIFIYVIISIITQDRYHYLLFNVCMQCSVKKTFDRYKLLLTAIYYLRPSYYLRRLYITVDGYMLTFDGYILLLAFPYSGFVRMQDFLAIYRIYGLKPRLEFAQEC